MPRWEHPAPETGRLEEPKFVRGFDPLNAPRWQPQRPNPWRRHFELGRQYPRQWMLISEVRKGGCKQRLLSISADRSAFKRFAQRENPLERWELRVVTVAGTYCDRELYARFLGELTPEEDVLDRKQRHEAYEARMAAAKVNKERRAIAARQKAQAEEAAAQVRIRSRRKPGQ